MDGLMEIQVIGLVDTNMYGGINDRKGEFLKGRFVSWTQKFESKWNFAYTRVGTLIVATIYLQLIQNGYMYRSFTLLQCSHQHCVQPVASDVEVVGYL